MIDSPAPMRLAFFLGGSDLEMVTIRDLASRAVPDHVFDKRLSWGARASAYRDEIRQVVEAGRQPVFVELENDIAFDAILVDHHGDTAVNDAPTSLEQVFALLRLPPNHWTRWLELVAANDRGYIPELRRIGATDEEILAIRAADREAQGITPEEEFLAARAIHEAEWRAEKRLLVVRLPHARTAVVTDPLELSDSPPENLLIISPLEVNFFGHGEVIDALRTRYPGGWSGGALPDRGFWGHAGIPPSIESFIEECVSPVRIVQR